MIQRHEDDLMAARHASQVDARQVNHIRYILGRLYGYFWGIHEAIDAYLRQQQHSA